MGIISGNGILQDDLVTLLKLINTNFTAMLVKLDADATLTDDTYESGAAITFPSAYIQNEGIRSQGDIIDFLNTLVTNFNAVLAMLDADTLSGLDADYVSTLAITDVLDPAVGTANAIMQTGMYQGDLVKLLNTIVTNFNLLLAKLDADPLAASDYVSACAVTDSVDETGC